jgi:DNA invertase Pin-like site-specific DNA recombinase
MTSTDSTERAGIWLRVSSAGQDEENQLPEVMRWCESHNYGVAEEYLIHGKSAFKGSRKFDAMWSRVIDDMHQGKISVLVVWKQDRIDRKLSTFQMLAEVVKAGGRVEFVTQPHLNDLTTMGGRIALKVQEEIAYAESKDKSDRIRIKHDGLREKGSAIGRAPWGYDIVKRDGVKVFAPNALGRAFVPAIFGKVIDGQSLRDVCLWLAENGITDKQGNAWSDMRLSRVIRNPAYFGQRRNSGQLLTEGLVTLAEAQTAIAAMESRVSGGRSASIHEKALLTPECAKCGGPMYRVFVGPKSHRAAYYRCAKGGKDHAPMIPLEELDSEVTEVMLLNADPHVARVFIPGDDKSDEIGKLRQAAMNAYLRDDREEFARLDSEANALESQPGTVAHWEERETGQTMGEHFASLSLDERRAELRQNWVITAEMVGEREERHLAAGIMPREWVS